MSQITTFIILAATLLGVSGCVSFGRKAPVSDDVLRSRQLSRQGMADFHRGRWQEAVDKLRAAVMTCPEDCQARRNYADLLRRNGDLKGAIAQMESAIGGSEPADATALVQLGQLYLQNGESARASELADRAIQQDVGLAAAWSLKGQTQFENGQLEKALSTLQRAVSLGDNEVATHAAIAEVYHKLARPRRTLTTIQALTERLPVEEQSQRLLHLRGLALVALERPSDAAEAMQLAVSKGRPTPQLMVDLAKAQYGAGQLAASDWSAKQAIKLAGGGDDMPTARALIAQIATARRIN